MSLILNYETETISVDRIARRSDDVTDDQRRARLRRMQAYADRVEASLTAFRVSDALQSTGDRLTVTEVDRLAS